MPIYFTEVANVEAISRLFPFPYRREHVHGLYDDLQSYLRISARISAKVGEVINEGEDFTIKVTGSNAAPSKTRPEDADIIFVNPWVFIHGTAYAKPKPDGYFYAWHKLPDDRLYPGESSYVEFEFTALQSIEGAGEEAIVEHIATAKIWAKLDIDRYFTVGDTLEIRTNIVPS